MIRVVKIGGNVVDDQHALERFCREFAAMEGPKVLVHGGGVMASELQRRMGMEPVMVEGRRVTDEDTLKVVTMVYAGWCNKRIVSLLQGLGCNAMGLSGCDANVIRAEKRGPRTLSDGVTKVDYGYVGDVSKDSVNGGLIIQLLEMGIIPVFCAINHDAHGTLLNTNADTIASSISSAINAELLYCFEKNGVLCNRFDESSVIPVISRADFVRLKADGIISDGMLPKIENAFKALETGASGVVIRSSSNLLDNSGTRIVL